MQNVDFENASNREAAEMVTQPQGRENFGKRAMEWTLKYAGKEASD